MTTRLDDYPHAGGMRYAEGVPEIPTAAVSTLAAERLASLLGRGEDVVLHLELDCRSYPDAPSFNVVGELPGREHPEEVLVVGGHLDAWDVGQGAHDCGAGCCQSIEVVRLLKELDLVPRRTIRVVLFMNEENGLGGARAYYRDHQDEMGRHRFALESDRGGFTPRGFTTDAEGEARAVLEEVALLLEGIGASTLRRGRGGADVGPMAQSGVVTAGLYPDPQRYFDLHHSARDTLEQVSPRELELGAAAMAALLYVVADLEAPLPHN